VYYNKSYQLTTLHNSPDRIHSHNQIIKYKHEVERQNRMQQPADQNLTQQKGTTLIEEIIRQIYEMQVFRPQLVRLLRDVLRVVILHRTYAASQPVALHLQGLCGAETVAEGVGQHIVPADAALDSLGEVAVEVEDGLELLVRGRIGILPDVRQEHLFAVGRQGYGEECFLPVVVGEVGVVCVAGIGELVGGKAVGGKV
jgi:hypothetical protein